MKVRKKLALIAVGTLAALSFAFTNPDEKYFEIAKNLEIFASLFKEVNMFYVDEINPQELIQHGIESMLNSLDPYTNYIPEEQIEDYRVMTTGQYGGIGANVGMRVDPVTKKEKVVIIMPMEGFPAHKAGLLIGDEIIKIDDINVEKKDSEEVSQLLKGQAGTSIKLTIRRPGVEKPLDFVIKREKITISNVPYYGMVTPEVGIIQLTDFTQNAGREVRDALIKLKEQGAKNIILDLRDNPGGLLSEAVNVSNLFIPKGKDVVSTKGKVKEWNKTYVASNNPEDTEIPLIVLTNSSSASAAEIVSGVVQDYDRGIIVGQNSFGKGLVQATRSLSHNCKLKITVAKYYIPSGRCIQAIDYSHRNPDGSVGKIPDSLRRAFKTAGGRVVYDGGGVKPDVEVPRPNYAPITKNLLSKGFIFEYASYYRQKRPSIPSPREFKLTDAEYADFVKWLSDKDYDYTTQVEKTIDELAETAKAERYYEDIKTQLEELRRKVSHNKEQDLIKFKSEICQLLEKEIASRYYLEKGAIEATFDDDPDIQTALALFKDPARFRKILGK
ncbi:MAG: S41 family peptidase [Cytophagales bacterium]|nr:S41 family peptidase [Bernardetiaceae bacterium]MDW8209944.1 S41 family peptidase [Cytophagales bacterium]